MVAWIGSVAAGLVAAYLGWIHLYFAFIPVWILDFVSATIWLGENEKRCNAEA
jgi:hypothetical protein